MEEKFSSPVSSSPASVIPFNILSEIPWKSFLEDLLSPRVCLFRLHSNSRTDSQVSELQPMYLLSALFSSRRLVGEQCTKCAVLKSPLVGKKNLRAALLKHIFEAAETCFVYLFHKSEQPPLSHLTSPREFRRFQRR
ncbi:hypothetical protein O181_030237 [Austropuccinia psidii MF-1]|uniref:Uncharacterized protein n=1 Tax=Austropuccinia psidii MF-1 TaxID=1389203 RepID=A0A9Q3CVC8_9BASI|nr:hypothetical protein [Austropuccinia psidii MF-1]